MLTVLFVYGTAVCRCIGRVLFAYLLPKYCSCMVRISQLYYANNLSATASNKLTKFYRN